MALHGHWLGAMSTVDSGIHIFSVDLCTSIWQRQNLPMAVINAYIILCRHGIPGTIEGNNFSRQLKSRLRDNHRQICIFTLRFFW